MTPSRRMRALALVTPDRRLTRAMIDIAVLPILDGVALVAERGAR